MEKFYFDKWTKELLKQRIMILEEELKICRGEYGESKFIDMEMWKIEKEKISKERQELEQERQKLWLDFNKKVEQAVHIRTIKLKHKLKVAETKLGYKPREKWNCDIDGNDYLSNNPRLS